MATDVVVTLKGKCPRTNTLSTFHVFTSSSHLLTWEYNANCSLPKTTLYSSCITSTVFMY